MSCGLEQEGGNLITPMALAHPLLFINSRSRNKRWNLWVGRCVSPWWPLLPSRIKGLIMDMCVCVCLTSTPECVVLPPGNHEGAAWVIAPWRDNTCQQHTYPWLIPIITWCRQFTSLSTNILLIKGKLKLESRTIAVGFAMSPRNLGGKYRCTRVASSLGDNVIDHVVCLKAGFLSHTVLSSGNDEFYTYDISVVEQVGMSFNGIAYLMKVLAFV